jgi:2OG-Fe(II) oxygenase superfamily
MSASLFWRRHLSFDKVGIGMTVAWTLKLVMDAVREGRAPMQGSIPAREGNALGRVFTTIQCRQLERDGYIVMDNFLTKQQVEMARNSIETLDTNYQFRGSPSESFDNIPAKTRAFDRVIINRTGALDSVRQQVASFAKSLVDSDFQGFPDDAYKTSRLHVPAQMQVSICGGTETRKPGEESSTHNFYHKHLDSAGADNLGDLGIIGWIRSRHLRQRYLTCIVYLNPDWKEGDGGCLRVFPKGETDEDGNGQEPPHVDIAPLGGRMIVFSSPSLLHVVQATRVQRFACAVWLALE